MPESDTDQQHDDDDHEPDLAGGLTDEDAEKLLSDAVDSDDEDDSDEDDSDEDGTSGRKKGSDKDLSRLRDELNKWKSLARRHERQFKDTSTKLRKYEDANKSESQRMHEAAQESRTRAEKAEAALRRREIAEERAPEYATLAQIKAVAKRLSGDDDDALTDDADELFALLAPEPPKTRTPSRPKERLRGGGEPDEEPEETDPRRLADLIRKSK